MNATAHPTRPATVWDLLAVQATFHAAKTVTSVWHTGPAAGRVATWNAAPHWEPGAGVWETVLTDPSDLGPGEAMELGLDYYETPDKGERHLVHTDLRGVTLVSPDGSPRATYRAPDDAAVPYSPAELYAQDRRTYAALAAALTDLGYACEAEEIEIGIMQAIATGNGTAETGYLVVAAWTGYPGEPTGWILRPTHKDHDNGHYYTDDDNGPDLIDLNLPLDTPVETVAATVADWLTTHAPDLRTTP